MEILREDHKTQEQIKQLRIKIDGISQLVKELKPLRNLVIDLNKIPTDKGIDLEKFMYYLNNEGRAFVENNESGNAVQPLDLNTELHKCYDSLILAKAWLGKILKELGEETPYKNDGNRKTVEDIEPSADTVILSNGLNSSIQEGLNNGVFKLSNIINEELFKNKSHIEKVDWLREEIKNIIENTEDFSQEYPTIEIEQGFVYKYLSEARFWLGFELQRIKEESLKFKFE